MRRPGAALRRTGSFGVADLGQAKEASKTAQDASKRPQDQDASQTQSFLHRLFDAVTNNVSRFATNLAPKFQHNQIEINAKRHSILDFSC